MVQTCSEDRQQSGQHLSVRETSPNVNEATGKEARLIAWEGGQLQPLQQRVVPGLGDFVTSSETWVKNYRTLPLKYIFIKFCVQFQGFFGALKSPKDLKLHLRQRHRPLRGRRKCDLWACQTK